MAKDIDLLIMEQEQLWVDKTPSELKILLNSYEVDEDHLFESLRSQRAMVKALKAYIKENCEDGIFE